MTVQDLITQVRWQINDVDAAEYTDDELISYINIGIDWLSHELTRNVSPLNIKEVDIALTDGVASLPSDFIKEVAVSNGDIILESIPVYQNPDDKTYKIIQTSLGLSLVSDNANLKLIYSYKYPGVTLVTDEIQVPDLLLNLLREIVIFLALNRNEYETTVEQSLMAVFTEQVRELSNISESNYEITLSWQI